MKYFTKLSFTRDTALQVLNQIKPYQKKLDAPFRKKYNKYFVDPILFDIGTPMRGDIVRFVGRRIPKNTMDLDKIKILNTKYTPEERIIMEAIVKSHEMDERDVMLKGITSPLFHKYTGHYHPSVLLKEHNHLKDTNNGRVTHFFSNIRGHNETNIISKAYPQFKYGVSPKLTEQEINYISGLIP